MNLEQMQERVRKRFETAKMEVVTMGKPGNSKILVEVTDALYEIEHIITEVWNEAIKEERERCGQCILCTQDIDGDTCDCCKQNWERIDDPDLPRANITSDK